MPFFLYSIAIVLTVLLSPTGLCAEKPVDYVVRTPQPLEKIALRHQKLRYIELDEYIDLLKKWNPHIKNYDLVLPGTQMYLYKPQTPYVLGANYARPLELGFEREASYFASMDFGLSFFRRQLTQRDPNLDLSLESTQNSPMALESSLFIAPAQSVYYHELNLKFSYLLPSETNVADKELPETFEHKVSYHLYYNLKKLSSLKFKAGVAYQRLVAFNLTELSTNRNIEQNNYDILYLKVGLNYSYNGLYNLYSTVSLSFEKSLLSKNDFDEESVDANIFLIEHVMQVERTRYYLFYELESNQLSGLDSKLQRVGGGMRFLLF